MSDGKMERLVEQRPTAVFPPSFCPSLKTADYPRGQLRSKNSSCYLPRLNYTVATVLGISHLSPHSILEGRYSYPIFQRRKEVFKASAKNEWGWSSNPNPCDFRLHWRAGASPFSVLGHLTSIDASDGHGGFWELMKLCVLNGKPPLPVRPGQPAPGRIH